MKYKILLLLGGLLLSFATKSQDIHDYLILIDENLSLKVIDEESKVILAGRDESQRMPNFKVGAGYGVLPIETRLGPQNLKLFGEQMLAPFGSFKVKEALINEKAALKGSEAEVIKSRLFYRLEKNWYEMATINEVLSVEEKNLKILTSFEKIALAKNEAAQGRASDVLRAQMNINNAENQIELLRDKLPILREEFNALLNRDGNTSFTIPKRLELKRLPAENEDQLAQLVRGENPQLIFLDKHLRIVDKQVKVEELKNKPTLGLGLEYGFIGTRDDMNPDNNGKDVLMPRVMFSLPLFNGKANSAAVNRAHLERRSIEARRESIYNELETELRFALNKRSDALKKITLYDKQIKLAKSTQDMLLNGYSVTGNEFEEILRIQDTIYNLEVMQIQTKKDHNEAVSYIESLTGIY